VESTGGFLRSARHLIMGDPQARPFLPHIDPIDQLWLTQRASSFPNQDRTSKRNFSEGCIGYV